MATVTAKQDKEKEQSVEEKLRSLYRLQTMLSEIDRIKTLRGELPLEVQDLEDEIAGLETRIQNIEEDIKRLQEEIASRRNDIDNAQNLIAKYTNQQENVKNNREYDFLSKEIEFQNLEIELCEKKIREADDRINGKYAEEQQARFNLQDRQEDLVNKKNELEEIVAETKQEEETLREESKELETQIEPRLLQAFKRIRRNARNGLAVVYIQRDACGGCFNKIPPQRQLDVKLRKKIIVCEYCGRIMIDPELAGVTPEAGK
jgi:predicted  nucleic acid-binding Zn-ribbon protein